MTPRCAGAVAALGLVLAGCAGGMRDERARAPRAAAPTGPGFVDWEAAWLAQLGATDPRLAMRMEVKPSADVLERLAAAAVVHGDRGVGIVGGALDVFSFAERARQLGILRMALTERMGRQDEAPEWSRDEKVLLGRLLDGEDLRVAREQASPESASERVRAIVETWGHPASPSDVDARERLVARGLLEVVADVEAGRLRGAAVLELEDALDALERIAVPEGYPEATRTIATLRIELGKRHPVAAPRADVEAPLLAALLRAYFGNVEATRDRETLVARLSDEEVALRADLRSRFAKMPEHTVNEVLGAAALHVDVETPCVRPTGPSVVRAMKPPPERAFVCDALELVASARDVAPLEEAVAIVALHDDVAIALWALALDAGATDLDATRSAHPILASVPHDRQDRLIRAALVSPARAVGPGLAAVLLDAEGPSERRGRATRWVAFGDAPFDVVAGHLAANR